MRNGKYVKKGEIMKNFLLVIVCLISIAMPSFSFNSNYGETGAMPYTKLKIVEVTNYPAESGLPSRIQFSFLRESTGQIVYEGWFEVPSTTNKEIIAALMLAYANDIGVGFEFSNDNHNMNGSKLHIRK